MAKSKKKNVDRSFKLSINDIVFAKVKGYPYWPAQVREIIGDKYGVTFFGTEENAKVPHNSVAAYNDENIVKYKKDTPKYKHAMDAVAEFLKNDDKSDEEEPINKDSENKANESVEPGRNATENEESNQKTTGTEDSNKRANEKEEEITEAAPQVKKKKRAINIKVERESLPGKSVHEEKVVEGLQPKLEWLQLQLLLLETTQIIRSKLSVLKENVDINEALFKMQELQKVLPKASSFVLAKYPNIVDTQRNLSRYTGDLTNWNMSKKERKTWDMKTGLIREIAKENINIIDDVLRKELSITFEKAFKSMIEEIQRKREEKNLGFDDFFKITSFEDFEKEDKNEA